MTSSSVLFRNATFLIRFILFGSLLVVALLAWPSLGRRSGTSRSLREIPNWATLGPRLETFPIVGEVHWEQFSERPPRLHLTGRLDIDRFYLWAFGAPRPIHDDGMGSIAHPNPPSEIGKVGDRFYETDGISGNYRYDVRVLLDGSYRIDLVRKPVLSK